MAERLIGSDGKLVTITFGTQLEGIGDAIPSDGWYRVDEIGGTTDLPTGAAVGKLVYLEEDDTLASGDKVTPLVENEQADITAFNLEISRAEIDVTTLSDSVRRYRAGKVDMNGSFEGITTLGETESEGWVLNNFIDVVKQNATGVTITDVDEQPIYMKGYIQKDETFGANEAFVWARIIMLSTSLGASGEDAQNFTSNFRIAAGDPDPTLYIRELGSAT